MNDINKICTISGQCFNSIDNFIASKTGLQLEELAHLGIQFGTGAKGGGMEIVYQRKQLWKELQIFKSIIDAYDESLLTIEKFQGSQLFLNFLINITFYKN